MNFHWQLFPGFQTSVQDNRLNLQLTAVILYEEKNITLRSHHHDVTHLNSDENHNDVVLEMHLATQNNNARDVNTERNYFHNRGADPEPSQEDEWCGFFDSFKYNTMLIPSGFI